MDIPELPKQLDGPSGSDLYYHDEKNGREIKKDLGFGTPKVNSDGLSTPIDIKLKRSIEQLSFSHRMDEISYAAVHIMAEDCGLSMNDFFNELIHDYIDKNRNRIEGWVYPTAINLFLDRLNIKYSKPENLARFKERLEKHRAQRHVDEVLTRRMIICLDACFFFDDSCKEASFRNLEKEYTPQLGEVEFFDNEGRVHMIDPVAIEWNQVYCGKNYDFTIPEEQWFVLVPILLEYQEKVGAFKGQKRFNDESAQKLCDILNKNQDDINKLVRSITNGLKEINVGWNKCEKVDSIWGYGGSPSHDFGRGEYD